MDSFAGGFNWKGRSVILTIYDHVVEFNPPYAVVFHFSNHRSLSGMLRRNRHTDFVRDADAITRIGCGRIVMENGKLVAIERHFWPSPVSIAQVWWESERGRIRGDVCYLDYHIPRGLPQFITLDYIRSGRQTRYQTFIGACHVLNEIARRRQSSAIVAHVTNSRISDRLLQRQGWERHMPQWRGRHFIRRFYEGYPSIDLARYA